MSKEVTIKLRVPIQFGNQSIAEMTFRPMRAGDHRNLDMTEARSATDLPLELAARLGRYPDMPEGGKLPAALIDRLEIDDWHDVRALVLSFLGRSQPDGKKASPT